MGLDMYIMAKKFIWTEEQKEKEQDIFKLFPEMKGFEFQRIEFEVAYWRKANMIHNWFVTNIQKEKDDCGDYDISKKDLESLKSDCLQVLKDKKLASEVLETKTGFFYGSQDYDEYYFEELQRTVEIIDKILKLSECWDLQYISSW